MADAGPAIVDKFHDVPPRQSAPKRVMAGLVDPTVTGNYPVILGDGLLGKTSHEIFTGVRCRILHLEPAGT